MKPESRTSLHVTVFVCIITLLIMTACGIGKTGSGAGTDIESSNSVRDLIVEYFDEHSPVEPTVDNNWKITGVDLSLGDPRRAEIIGWINEGRLEVPYNESYNLEDYEELVAGAEG